MKFRKKPIEIEAVRYTGTSMSFDRVKEFCTNTNITIYRDKKLKIPTLEGFHDASIGDWIIRGVEGEFYPCKPGIFEKTYDKVI